MIKLQYGAVPLMVIWVFLGLTGCSGLNKLNGLLSDKKNVNYQVNTSVKDLEFPPDLTAPEFDNEFRLPNVAGRTVSMNADGVIPAQSDIAREELVANTIDGRAVKQRSRKLATINSEAGEVVLHIHDTYARALIMTQIMLERMKFSLLNQDAVTGVFEVKYKGISIKGGSKGGFLSGTKSFFKNLTSTTNNTVLLNGANYQVMVKNQGNTPLLYFRAGNGDVLSKDVQIQIISLFDREFNRKGK